MMTVSSKILVRHGWQEITINGEQCVQTGSMKSIVQEMLQIVKNSGNGLRQFPLRSEIHCITGLILNSAGILILLNFFLLQQLLIFMKKHQVCCRQKTSAYDRLYG